MACQFFFFVFLQIEFLLILTHAIEWLSHKSIDLYSFAQMV